MKVTPQVPALDGMTPLGLPEEKGDALYIVDDGTMDTVVACGVCDYEERFNPDFEDGDEDGRINAALEMAAAEHDLCEPEAGPLN